MATRNSRSSKISVLPTPTSGRPAESFSDLTGREAQLVMIFRQLSDERRERLLFNANEMLAPARAEAANEAASSSRAETLTEAEAKAIVEVRVFDAQALVAVLVESWHAEFAEIGETEIDVARRRTVRQIGEHLEVVAATF